MSKLSVYTDTQFYQAEYIDDSEDEENNEEKEEGSKTQKSRKRGNESNKSEVPPEVLFFLCAIFLNIFQPTQREVRGPLPAPNLLVAHLPRGLNPVP